MRFSANNELALHVADPASAERFYTETLGCAAAPGLLIVARQQDAHSLPSDRVRRENSMYAIRTVSCSM